MLAQDIKFSRKSPITGIQSKHAWYAAVEEAVFAVAEKHDGHVMVFLADSHLDSDAYGKWMKDPRFLLWEAAGWDEAREMIAERATFENAAYQQALEAWQMIPVDETVIPQPYRIVRVSPVQIEAVSNNPAAHVHPFSQGGPRWADGTPKLTGSVVLAEATKWTYAETEGHHSGWMVTVGGNSFPVGQRRDDAIYAINDSIDDTFARTGRFIRQENQ